MEKYTVRFTWTPELWDSASKACVRATTGRVWLFLAAGLMFCPSALFDYIVNGRERSLITFFVGVFCISVYGWHSFTRKRALRDLTATITDPEVQLTISAESLVFINDQDRSTIHLKHVTKSCRVDGFLLLFTGSVLLAAVPEQFLSEDQIQFIRSVILSERTNDK